MTPSIRALDEQSIRQIAAGEVVERPASVVKELIENSLDAGSRRIVLEIKGGGKELIRIADDGCGIQPAEVELALERHTTSKIRNSDDLSNLSTFGFRGEALPSIASVSKMELVTRSANSPSAVSLTLEGGKLVSKKECARAPGTTMEVRSLFFNTPARLKFLKSDPTEKGRILKVFEEIALAHPEISFEIKIEQRAAGEYPSRTKPIQRVLDLWGESVDESKLVPILFEHPQIRIEGWISSPDAHQPTKNLQVFYVNRRPIVSRFISHAVYESYRDCLPVGRHPAAVLFIQIEPSEVDVNVHPSKREVRFRNEHPIYEAIVREIRAKRSSGSAAPNIFEPAAASAGASIMSAPSPTEQSARYQTQPAFSQNARSESPIHTHAPAVQQETRFENHPRVLSVFHSLYVLAEQGENLMIVDQHAAAERILYEKFRAAYYSDDAVPAQTMLVPYLWHVTLEQAELLGQHLELFRKMGFAMELFGEKTFRINECPALVPETGIKETLDEILAALESQKSPTLAVEDKIMHAACRAAIKANDRLSNRELEELLAELARCANPHTCPHGRPTMQVISRQELDKKFGRT